MILNKINLSVMILFLLNVSHILAQKSDNSNKEEFILDEKALLSDSIPELELSKEDLGIDEKEAH